LFLKFSIGGKRGEDFFVFLVKDNGIARPCLIYITSERPKNAILFNNHTIQFMYNKLQKYKINNSILD